jgi:hypothetical protein
MSPVSLDALDISWRMAAVSSAETPAAAAQTLPCWSGGSAVSAVTWGREALGIRRARTIEDLHTVSIRFASLLHTRELRY